MCDVWKVPGDARPAMILQCVCVCVLPSVLQCLDVEAQRGGDGAHVLAVELLQDGCFPRVVQTSARATLKTTIITIIHTRDEQTHH